jgi:hypothetical protein
MKILHTGVIALAVLFAAGSLANAGDAPSIGGGASIDVSVKGAVANAGNVDAGTASIKQAVGSVISGSISGKLKDNVNVEGALVNAGNVEGGTATICQSIGTIGSNCNS